MMAVMVRDTPTTGPVTEATGEGSSNPSGKKWGIQFIVVIPSEPVYGNVSRMLQDLGHLRRGWDGHDAVPPRGEAIEEALTFVSDLQTFYRGLVPAPSVGPSPDGGVLLVWRRPTTEAEVLFRGRGTADFALSDREGVRPTEFHDGVSRHELLALTQSHLIP
jgi:hypothetical protein